MCRDTSIDIDAERGVGETGKGEREREKDSQ